MDWTTGIVDWMSFAIVHSICHVVCIAISYSDLPTCLLILYTKHNSTYICS